MGRMGFQCVLPVFFFGVFFSAAKKPGEGEAYERDQRLRGLLEKKDVTRMGKSQKFSEWKLESYILGQIFREGMVRKNHLFQMLSFGGVF